MKIQLFLNDLEVELNDNINFPLTKTFENLSNPTDIIVDYSKTINIPITPQNTQIFGQIFKLDQIIVGGDTNIGMYFDPTQKIDFKLLYNGDVLLEGYAKFLSTQYSVGNKYYTISLFGRLGDIFQKLMSVVLSEEDLNDDLDENYILDDHLDGTYINKELIKECWDNDTPELKLSTSSATDIIGFAPTYRGYYGNDFNSDEIQKSISESVKIEQFITDKYKQTYKSQYPTATDDQVNSYIDSLDVPGIVGDGFKEYEMNQYRSYQQKPYIYFNKLLQMYQEVLPKISDYSLELDSDWFNVNNPYWYRLCYMLDYLEERGTVSKYQTQTDLFRYANGHFDRYGKMTTSTTLDIEPRSSIELSPFTLQIKQTEYIYNYEGKDRSVYLRNTSSILVNTKILRGSTQISNKNIYFVADPNNSPINTSTNEVYPVNQQLTFESRYGESVKNYVVDNIYCKVPPISLYGDIQSGDTLQITVSIIDYNKQNTDNVSYPFEKYYWNGKKYVTQILEVHWNANEPTILTEIRSLQRIYISNIKGSYIPLKLKNLYKQEQSLFNVILQYTKMFGLLWDIDYVNRKIKIITRDNYFKNNRIIDWSSKLDTSTEFNITPITFDSKTIKFNYDEVDGYRFTGYNEKYNSVYGDKKIYTSYNFNTEDKNLFDGIKPSCVSSRSYRDFQKIYNWNLSGEIQQRTDQFVRIEDSDESDESSANVNGWYFRNDNITTDSFYITDDSTYQSQNTPCYYNLNNISSFSDSITSSQNFPQFNIVNIQDVQYGCIFNKPLEDYSYNNQISYVDNFIYNTQWEKYINERYNIQNKKITTYFNLTPVDYINFKFSDFVTIQNQLFMINKIQDFKLGQSGLTKCELIQITDTSAYTDSQLNINPFYVDKSYVFIDMDREQITTPNGIFTINVYTDDVPTVTLGSFNVGSIVIGTSKTYPNRKSYVFSYRNMLYTNQTLQTTITFTNKYGSITIPVTIIGGRKAEIIPNLYAFYITEQDFYIPVSFTTNLPEYRPYTLSLNQTSSGEPYGSVELDDIRNDSNVSIDAQVYGTHFENEIWEGELYSRNQYVSIRVPFVIDTTPTRIYCDQDEFYTTDFRGWQTFEFRSDDPNYTIDLVEKQPTDSGYVEIIDVYQENLSTFIQIEWGDFTTSGTWMGDLVLTNSGSRRRIPIIINIRN